ncbi:hypothetical protein CP532_4898 [Ophiocordyceps camponoti-leonardi (nom. inval.)]|nr:hypothetical protein CP532_4898 [Ophiocordyceps camponoti-leonardi (nom. inval.)]
MVEPTQLLPVATASTTTPSFKGPDHDREGRGDEEDETGPTMVESHDDEMPTASHALADESIRSEPKESKGVSQMEHDEVEVKNVGWNDDGWVSQQVMGGMRNDELWTLIRRFNKFVFRVRSIEEAPLATLDMNVADEDDFSPDKLRATLERLYMTVLVSLLSGWKHVARIRSWREYRRTAIFMIVYAAAWFYDMLVPTFVLLAMTLILFPSSRSACFPPVPPALVSAKTGGVQKPAAGVLASTDSMTGAPEKHKGEGVEQEAHNFINTLSTLAISATAGKNPHGEPHEDNNEVPDPTKLADGVANVRARTNGSIHDQTREPVSRAVWNKARPSMHLVCSLNDTWERFANALSPTRPFPQLRPRLVLAACLVPLLVAWWLLTPYMLLKGLGFVLGFGLFGEPAVALFVDVADWLYPPWHHYVQLRNSVLKGVPTNAQLTITLLRIGERNKAPLPPPRKTKSPPKAESDWGAAEELNNMGATDEEKRHALEPAAQPNGDDELNDERERRGTQTNRLFNLVKKAARGGVAAALTADKAKAVVGAKRARQRLGVVRQTSSTGKKGEGHYDAHDAEGGPVRFPARYQGRRGNAYVTSTATAPALSWMSTSSSGKSEPVWTVAIGDIDQISKVGGLGWKSKMLVGWALDSQIVDGLVVRTKQGVEYHLTAIVVRDELFNRLIAIGSQMWEAW